MHKGVSSSSRAQTIKEKMDFMKPILTYQHTENTKQASIVNYIKAKLSKLWNATIYTFKGQKHVDDEEDDELIREDLNALRFRVDYVSKFCPLSPYVLYVKRKRNSTRKSKARRNSKLVQKRGVHSLATIKEENSTNTEDGF